MCLNTIGNGCMLEELKHINQYTNCGTMHVFFRQWIKFDQLDIIL